MATEGQYPKVFEDIQYASEVNTFNTNIASNTTHRGNSGTDHSLLAIKTSYWAIRGNDFKAETGTQDYAVSSGGAMNIDSTGVFYATVHLPHGAVITNVAVYGNDSGESWSLYTANAANGSATASTLITSHSMNSTRTISHTVNNQFNGYYFKTSSLDSSDVIRGARITYTTNYI